MKYIYIAGPYTKPDPVINTQIAIRAGEEVIKLGAIPFVPHLTHLWHLISPHDIQFWYHLDLRWLRRCDALFRFQGESSGADVEVDFAKTWDIPVFDDWDHLKEWINEN